MFVYRKKHEEEMQKQRERYKAQSPAPKEPEPAPARDAEEVADARAKGCRGRAGVDQAWLDRIMGRAQKRSNSA